MNTAIRRRQFGLVGFLAFILSLTVGCADLNDDPPPANSGSGGVTFSLTALAQQLGYRTDPTTGLHTTPAASEATTPVVALVSGAIVVRSRTLAQGPYSDSVPITNLETQLETDLLNSIESLQLVQLPLPPGQHNVTVRVPGPAAEKWQFLGAAFTAAADGTSPQNLADLGEDKFQDSAVYFGFHPQFLKTSVSGQTVTLLDAVTGAVVPETALTLTLKRACLITTPPNGCAQFDDDAARTPKVTAAVEITGVLVNGAADSTLNYPLQVRSGATGSCLSGYADSCTAAIAIQRLASIPLTGATTTIVRTTHQLSPGQSTTCQLASTVGGLETACGVQTYFTGF